MKKLLVIPAIIGLLAIPSVVLARHGADDNKPNGVRREDRSQDSIPTLSTQVAQNSQDDNSPDDEDDNQTPIAVPEGSITLDQARTIAQDVFPDKTIKKVETEVEHGILVYSVRFTDSSRVDVQSSDGAIVRTESENEDDHDSDESASDDDDNSTRGSDDD